MQAKRVACKMHGEISILIWYRQLYQSLEKRLGYRKDKKEERGVGERFCSFT
jgi:hypothetical protein